MVAGLWHFKILGLPSVWVLAVVVSWAGGVRACCFFLASWLTTVGLDKCLILHMICLFSLVRFDCVLWI